MYVYYSFCSIEYSVVVGVRGEGQPVRYPVFSFYVREQ